jgi:CheY-like chemotaxis protein
VLVVDDSAVARLKLRKLLESSGYQVTLAENGLQAEVRLLKDRFDLLITDLEMPEMDGFALIASVHGSLETENLPIIAITGHEELQARVHACEGIYGLFQKPWNDRDLLRRVAALVHLGNAMQHSVEQI